MLVATIAPLLGLRFLQREREAFSLNMDIFSLYVSQPNKDASKFFLLELPDERKLFKKPETVAFIKLENINIFRHSICC